MNNNHKPVSKEAFDQLVQEMDFVCVQIRHNERHSIYNTKESAHRHRLDNDELPEVSSLVPFEFSRETQQDLVAKTKFFIEKYLALKAFIIDVHVENVMQAATSYGKISSENLNQQKQAFANEMDIVLQDAIALAMRVSQMPAHIERDLLCQELEETLEMLEHRVNHYTYLYQSYLADLKYAV